MATTYTNAQDLLGKTLEVGDVVIFKRVRYRVKLDHLHPEIGMHKVFEEHGFERKKFCDYYYGYGSIGYKEWPKSQEGDCEALTRATLALLIHEDNEELKK